jgi:catechol 2,3-dioxygenase-like lactoylglutathione lyase family enzyme
VSSGTPSQVAHVAQVAHVIVGSSDPAGLAGFWSAALGWSVLDDGLVAPPEGLEEQRGQLPLVFVRDDRPKAGKNRVHLDLASRSDRHQAELVARLEQLGARRLDIGQAPDATWVVMADPQGNELCVVSHAGSVGADPSSAFGALFPIAAVVVDAPDPDAAALAWSSASGWPILGRDGTHVWLRDPASNAPYLDVRHTPDPPPPPTTPARLTVAFPTPTPPS